MTSTRPALPLTGGCMCRAIRYEIGSFPLLLYTCNCTNCQKQSGSAFGMTMPVAAKDFRIMQGAESLALAVARGRRSHFVVLRRLRQSDLRRTSGTPGKGQYSGRYARRHHLAGAGRSFLYPQRAIVGQPCGRCHLLRDPALRCTDPRSGLARAMAVSCS